MPIPVLSTKLYIPQHPHNAVIRSRLIERLDEDLCRSQENGRKLTLISAPAGYGKTTLVSEWVAGCDRRVAWLSLDETDSEPARFLTYFIAALQMIAPAIGEELLTGLGASQPPALDLFLTPLLNEIALIPEDFILVLDDYHVIDSQAIDDAIIFLIEHLPPQMRLVITTREDPRFPLARLRSRGHLNELRAPDLRFTSSEAATFFQAMSLTLSPNELGTLETRTEGWIAGLQLAALSMQNQPDTSEFIRRFAGDHRYIIDYLVEEVLQRQPDAIRRFLLQTAILDRLCGPLCDAVTGQEDGSLRLESLERGNYFVISLDDNRRWYRYHHLFAQVLYAHLLSEQPDQVTILHQRASEWYEQQGVAPEAIRHALAGKDFDRAARLIELAAPAMRQDRQEIALLNWLRALPDELIRLRPVLSVLYAGVLLASGELEGVESHLRDAERWIDTTDVQSERTEIRHTEIAVVDEKQFHRLPAEIALDRAASALALGNVDDAIKYARIALGRTPEGDHLGIGAATAILGLAYWAKGDLEPAYQTYAAGMASVEKAGYLPDTVASAITLADIRIAQGGLNDAMRTYEWGLKLATEPGKPVLRGAADMHVGMSALLRERNDLAAAKQHLLQCQELGEHMGLPQNRYRWRVALARVREVEGDLDGALDLLDEAERVYWSDFSPNLRPIPAMKARVWIAQGRLDKALDWARKLGLSFDDELSYVNEFAHLTLVRVLLAVYQHDRTGQSILEAMQLLERLLKAAEDGGRAGSVIEILIMQALGSQLQGNLPTAIACLERSLRLADPEGYVRIFVDEGPPMLRLLQEAGTHGIMPDYTNRLRAAFTPDSSNAVLPTPHTAYPTKQPLIEPLSQRELEVLRLFKTELSGPEIASRLVIGLSTVRTHTKSIYGKLNVNNRRAAVRKAEELNLI